MKKLTILLFLFITFLLTACVREGKGSEAGKGLIINKLLTTANANKLGLLEIKNTSKAVIQLSKYKVNVYKNGDLDEAKVISLSGELKENEKFLIAVTKDGHGEEIKKRINLIANELKRNGTFPISITKGDKIIDVIGYLGAATDFSSKATLVRFKGKETQRTKFTETDYCYLKKEYYEIFYNNEEYSYDEVLKGPQFDQSKLLESNKENYTKFMKDIRDKKNTKELIKVSVNRYIDGDTTEFNELERMIEGNRLNYSKVRYQGMDTPESQKNASVNYEPYGKVASALTKHLLKKAKGIYVQISGEGPTLDTYSRSLLLVWTNKSLIPFVLVKNGLARYRFDGIQSTDIYYNNISLHNYIQMAEFYAIENKLNIHSGKDSDDTFDYNAKKYKPGVSEDTIDIYKYANIRDYE